MITAKELAETYMAMAQQNFVRDGGLDPLVAFHGGPTSLLVELEPNKNFHPSDQAVAITFAFATVLPMTYIVAINETWMKKFDPEAQPENLQRGQLEALHEQGDSAVHTSLLVIVADVKDHEGSFVKTRDVDEGGEEDTETWTDSDLGLKQGSYLDRLLGAYEQATEVAKSGPTPPDWPAVAALLAHMDIIHAIHAIGSQDDVAESLRRVKAGEN